MTTKVKQAALYVRVSTDGQTVENQTRELRQIAERRGWKVVETYSDAGISGSKGRDKRPGLDQMLNDASRRKFDVVMAWSIDRLGRSLIDLLATVIVPAQKKGPRRSRSEGPATVPGTSARQIVDFILPPQPPLSISGCSQAPVG